MHIDKPDHSIQLSGHGAADLLDTSKTPRLTQRLTSRSMEPKERIFT